MCAAILEPVFKKFMLDLDTSTRLSVANMLDESQFAFKPPLCCKLFDLTNTSIEGFAGACHFRSVAMAMDAIAYVFLIILTLLVCSVACLGCQKMAS